MSDTETEPGDCTGQLLGNVLYVPLRPSNEAKSLLLVQLFYAVHQFLFIVGLNSRDWRADFSTL